MTNDNNQSVCPRCGREFSCSKSGKCWCYEVFIPPDAMEEIERLYDGCLCPDCLKEFAEKENTAHKKTL